MISTKLKIFVIGEVSMGKSSFINALACSIVSNTSLQRETFHVKRFCTEKNVNLQYIREISNELNQFKNDNDMLARNINLSESTVGIYETLYMIPNTVLDNVIIYDFPGIGDSIDNNDLFYKEIEKNIGIADIVLYLSDAYRPFTSKTEVDYFLKIKELISIQCNNGKYTKLLVILNKFDNINDSDLNEFYTKLPPKIGIDLSNIYRISSHKLLINNIKKYNKELYIPTFYMKELQNIVAHSGIIVNSIITE